ncbi:MAG: hypothetical protein ACFFGP_11820 [Promethearchaeota archaeon]
MYCTLNKYYKAKKFCLAALKIYEPLFNKYPKVYSFNIIDVIKKLQKIYTNLKMFKEAEELQKKVNKFR